jgi:hypothetical protein
MAGPGDAPTAGRQVTMEAGAPTAVGKDLRRVGITAMAGSIRSQSVRNPGHLGLGFLHIIGTALSRHLRAIILLAVRGYRGS